MGLREEVEEGARGQVTQKNIVNLGNVQSEVHQASAAVETQHKKDEEEQMSHFLRNHKQEGEEKDPFRGAGAKKKC